MVYQVLKFFFNYLVGLLLKSVFGIENTKINKRLNILYQSDNYIVVNKDFDLRINSNDPVDKASLHYKLLEEFPSCANTSLKHYFYFIHRLDYATSGIICIALNKKACAEASKTFELRSAKKYYLAILRGHVSKDKLDISDSVGELLHDNDCNKMGTVSSGQVLTKVRSAYTKLFVLERGLFACYPATKVLLMPLTGRRHQLRVHCSHIGHTIVGDYTYSNRKDISPSRTYLHSYRLMMPSKVESLDIRTLDPFPPTDILTGWYPVELVNPCINEIFEQINFDIDHPS